MSKTDPATSALVLIDAMTALSAISPENALTKIFPRLGKVVTTEEAPA